MQVLYSWLKKTHNRNCRHVLTTIHICCHLVASLSPFEFEMIDFFVPGPLCMPGIPSWVPQQLP